MHRRLLLTDLIPFALELSCGLTLELRQLGMLLELDMELETVLETGVVEELVLLLEL